MFNIWFIQYPVWWSWFTFNDINTFSYSSTSYSVAWQESLPTSIAFNEDGTKMFILWFSWDDINEYTLSIWYDLSSTVTFVDSFSISTQDNIPSWLHFKEDGTKFWIVWRQTDTVYQYSCSTEFDISTSSYDSKSFSVSWQDTNPYEIRINPDGDTMMMVWLWTDTVYEYSLSTAFDISTSSYTSKSFWISWQDTLPRWMEFSPDWTKMLIVGTSSVEIHQYTLSTWWDISTASYDSLTLSVSAQDTQPLWVIYNNLWDKLFIVWNTWDSVYEYSI